MVSTPPKIKGPTPLWMFLTPSLSLKSAALPFPRVFFPLLKGSVNQNDADRGLKKLIQKDVWDERKMNLYNIYIYILTITYLPYYVQEILDHWLLGIFIFNFQILIFFFIHAFLKCFVYTSYLSYIF